MIRWTGLSILETRALGWEGSSASLILISRVLTPHLLAEAAKREKKKRPTGRRALGPQQVGLGWPVIHEMP